MVQYESSYVSKQAIVPNGNKGDDGRRARKKKKDSLFICRDHDTNASLGFGFGG